MIDNAIFNRKVVMQPGKILGWSACLSLDMADQKEGKFLLHQMRKRATLTEDEILYLPPEVKDGALLSGIMVSEGKLVEDEVETIDAVQPLQATTV